MILNILESIKKVLGLSDEYTAFDQDIIMHINSVLSDLHLLGIGPVDGFQITDKTALWSDYLDNDLTLNNVKTYIALRVRLLFDPPASSFAIEALNNQIQAFEWKINVVREGVAWTDPNPPESSEEN